ncbi:hypothetical protein GN244_ATG18730 [Phytophthora infestans]|uniref:Uncharacterized protein n=1 Tax=Phytophthora infestans TaxID=4787 RepID=A0A833W4K9_PHYIN|nr:hypothetical protein GN244_ATG18730 [Phytophthora infestans]KAF4140216.1 hypothetical protein GN958_ATG10568 [Phytophthora infestans]
MRGDGRKKTKCSHCQRGYHNEGDCRVKTPDKRPNFQQRLGKTASSDKTGYKAKYYALIDKLVVDDDDTSTSPLNE